MKIKFCGAAREVTGSSHLVTLKSGYTILLDCGLYQGEAEEEHEIKAFNDKWLFDPSKIDCMILSHAHVDHLGRIPRLVRDGFKGEIYCTHATRSLASIMLMDSANIQESEARETDEEPYYTRKDVSRALQQFVGLSFEKWHYLTDEVRFFLRNTGHMLGSASVSLEVKEEGKKILFGFTGDIGRGNRPILPDPAPMPEMDYLICESTYGNKDHETAANETDRLVDIVEEICLKRKGKLLIPAFSVGRTQEIVYLLDQAMTQRSLPAVTVYVDSPMAINAVEVFRMHPECFDEEMNNYLQDDPNPFGFKSLFYVRSSEESKELPFSDEPCIIISASGMMNSGRAKSHLANLVEDSKNGVLLVGYASPNSPAGKLKRGEDSIHLYNDWKKVNLKVFSMDSFSAHADRYELLAFIRNQAKGLKKLFLTHGEYDTQIAFKALLNQYGFDNVEIPSLGQVFEIGE